MKKHILFLLLSITICISSCNLQTSSEQITSDANHDSLLRAYVIQIFGGYKETFNAFPNEQRTPQKEIIIYPGKFKLRSYAWGDGQTYRPFAIEVKDSNENVIDYFAFNDERIYLNRFDSIRLPMPNEKEIIFKEKENYIVQPKLLGTQLYQCIYW